MLMRRPSPSLRSCTPPPSFYHALNLSLTPLAQVTQAATLRRSFALPHYYIAQCQLPLLGLAVTAQTYIFSPHPPKSGL